MRARPTSSTTPQGDASAGFLDGGGAAGALVRSIDWSKTPLGPISEWPRSLLTTVGMLLCSRFPMFLWWGPELVQFYNDAYTPSFGEGKHPAAMGQRGRDCWQEIWPIIGPQIDDVMSRAIASWNEDALVPIFRNGRIEEVFWTYGYSPVFDESGGVGGTLVVCTETTARVIATRRSDFVRLLGEKLSACSDLTEIATATREACAMAKLDIPFVLTLSPGREPRSTGACGLAEDDAAAIVRAALARKKPVLEGLDVMPLDSPWPEPAREATVRTPRTAGTDTFVFGVSARLPFDAAYGRFFDQVVEQIDLAGARLEAFRVRTVVESERRNLLLQAPVATALLAGPDLVFELANPRFREIVGGREVVGKGYRAAFPELEDTPLVEVIERVYRTGEPFIAQEYLVPLDRSGTGVLEDCYYRFNLEPLRDGRGAVYGMMAIAIDITEQVRSRIALERTTEEREKLLVQLEAANHAKDEFLATVSHELRTPLTSILGWARLLSENSDPARLQKGLAVIERNAQAQAHIIEDILDVSRIISGKVRLNMRRVDPGAAVRAAAETVRPLATSKRITLDVTTDESIALVTADEDRLQQIVWNLLSNAVKFTAAGGHVAVSAARDATHVAIAVKDSGKGISPAFLPHVFDRFRQDDTSTTKQQAGLGLGLAIVRHLVALHGGEVTAHSEGEGRGATFEVRLPIQAVLTREESGEHERAPVIERMTASQRLAGLHVLVVDDQDDARDLVATVIGDAGAKVTQARSTAAAMKVLTEHDVSVVVSDIGMPGEDGYTFIHRLRSSEARKDVPALALTAYARPEDREKAMSAGFHEHVSKPINPLHLVELVARLARR